MLVKLHGDIGENFIPELEIFCQKPRDVIDIIDANFPGFRQYFLDRSTERFDVILNGDIRISQLELDFQFDNLKSLEIFPTIGGSGDNLQGILGLGLGLAALTIPGFQIFGMSATYVGLMGGLMAFQGFFGLKKGSKNSKKSDKEARRSELFNGTINTSGNQMIPIVVGRGIKTGSLAVSLDIKSSLSPV
jgi:predicted phage tail protein